MILKRKITSFCGRFGTLLELGLLINNDNIALQKLS